MENYYKRKMNILWQSETQEAMDPSEFINIDWKARVLRKESSVLHLMGCILRALLIMSWCNKTITADLYQHQLIRLSQELQWKRPYIDKGECPVKLLHVNARPHIVSNTKDHNESWLVRLAAPDVFTKYNTFGLPFVSIDATNFILYEFSIYEWDLKVAWRFYFVQKYCILRWNSQII